MKILRRFGSIVPVLAVLFFTAAAADAGVLRHSGRIVGIDRQGGRLLLAEVGPWTVEHGTTVIARLVVNVTDSTKFTLVRRVTKSSSGFRGDFVEDALDRRDLGYFDFVTIDCLHRNGHLIALKVAVLAPDMSGGEE